MLLRNLINPKPYIIIVFIMIWCLILFAPLAYSPFDSLFKHEWLSPFVLCILSLLLPAFHAIGLNNLVCEKNIIKKNNLITGFVYLFFCVPFYDCVNEWFISFFLLFFLKYLFDCYQKDNPFRQIFNSGLVIGLLTLLYPNLFVFSFMIFITCLNFGNISFRIILSYFIGMLVPLIFYVCFLIMFGYDFPSFKVNFSYNLNLPALNKNEFLKIFWISIVFLISLFSLYELYKWLYKKSLQSRKSFIIIFFYLILTFMFFIDSFKYGYLIIAPLSIIVGNYFTYTKRRSLANILFLMFLVTSIFYRVSIVF